MPLGDSPPTIGGGTPALKETAGKNPAPVVPISTETSSLCSFAIARSVSVPALNSPVAIARGPSPTAMSAGSFAKMLPVPPTSTETVSAAKFVVARSRSAPALNPPAASARGSSPTVVLTSEPNDPAPFPWSTETSSLNLLAVARSMSPSPSKSPVAIEEGVRFTPWWAGSVKRTGSAPAADGMQSTMTEHARQASWIRSDTRGRPYQRAPGVPTRRARNNAA